MAERDRHLKEIALKGKWISDLDGVVVAENFTTLRNLRYTDVYPRAVGGMTKLNSTAIVQHRVKNAHHFRRPATRENHLLLQTDHGTGTAGSVQTFESVVPALPTLLQVYTPRPQVRWSVGSRMFQVVV